MVRPEQPKHKPNRRESSHYSIWTLMALFFVALGIVFSVSKTGKAAVGRQLRFESPPPSPIDTPTPTPTVSPLPGPRPVLEDISPSAGVIDRPNWINIYGNHFQRGASVYIAWESHARAARAADTPNFIKLETVRIGRKHLLARVPASIAKGLYGVKVINPDGQRCNFVHNADEGDSSN